MPVMSRDLGLCGGDPVYQGDLCTRATLPQLLSCSVKAAASSETHNRTSWGGVATLLLSALLTKQSFLGAQ